MEGCKLTYLRPPKNLFCDLRNHFIFLVYIYCKFFCGGQLLPCNHCTNEAVHSPGLFSLQNKKRPCVSESFSDRKPCFFCFFFLCSGFICQIAIVPLPWDNQGVYVPAERLDRSFSLLHRDLESLCVCLDPLRVAKIRLLPGCHFCK